METITTYRPASPLHAVFKVDVSGLVGADYLPMLDDVVRMVCIQATIQLMIFMAGGSGPFFSADFVMLVLYVILGVMLYWLVIRKLVAFV